MSWVLIVLAAWLAPGVLVGLALLWVGWLGPMVRGERRYAGETSLPESAAQPVIRVRSPRTSAVLRVRGLRRGRVGNAVALRPGPAGEPGGLEPGAAHEVDDRPSAFQQIVGDDSPVASPPDGLGAHDRALALGA